MPSSPDPRYISYYLFPITFSYFYITDLQADQPTTEYDVLIGNREWAERNGLEVSAEVDEAMTAQEVQGETAVLCVIDG